MPLRVINLAGVGATVGIALLFTAVMMLIPLIISLLYQDGGARVFILSSASVGAVGAALMLLGRLEIWTMLVLFTRRFWKL